MNNKNIGKAEVMIITGLALILLVSLIEGFVSAALNAIYHIIKDFTVELLVHVYIAGIIFLLIGVLGYVKRL